MIYQVQKGGERMDIIYFILIPAIVSLIVSICFSRKVLDKVTEVMQKMDEDQMNSFDELSRDVIEHVKNINR